MIQKNIQKKNLVCLYDKSNHRLNPACLNANDLYHLNKIPLVFHNDENICLRNNDGSSTCINQNHLRLLNGFKYFNLKNININMNTDQYIHNENMGPHHGHHDSNDDVRWNGLKVAPWSGNNYASSLNSNKSIGLTLGEAINFDRRWRVIDYPPGDYNMSDMINRGIRNDTVSSFKVHPGYSVTLYQHANFRGYSRSYGPGIYNWVEAAGFGNDVLSSFKVHDNRVREGWSGYIKTYKVKTGRSGAANFAIKSLDIPGQPIQNIKYF